MNENVSDRLLRKESLGKALDVLRRGGIILYPTDTIWGIGCDATNSEAVGRIFELKRRADAKSMLMLVGSEGQLHQFVEYIPEVAWELMDVAVHPLTLIYDRPRGVAPELLAADGSAGFRVTREPFSAELCQRLRHPLVSTSANISGRPAPAFFDEITEEIINGVDYVVEYGRTNKTNPSPSNIIKITDSAVITIIR